MIVWVCDVDVFLVLIEREKYVIAISKHAHVFQVLALFFLTVCWVCDGDMIEKREGYEYVGRMKCVIVK